MGHILGPRIKKQTKGLVNSSTQQALAECKSSKSLLNLDLYWQARFAGEGETLSSVVQTCSPCAHTPVNNLSHCPCKQPSETAWSTHETTKDTKQKGLVSKRKGLSKSGRG